MSETPQKRFISLDLETLSLSITNTPIVEIGLVYFEPPELPVAVNDPAFYIIRSENKFVNPDSSANVSMKTLQWHLIKNIDFITEWAANPDQFKINTRAELCKWITERITPEDLIYVNHPEFDIAILKNLFASCNLPVPWHYQNIRDVSTIKRVFSNFIKPRPNKLKPHFAVNDAINQAWDLIDIAENVYNYTNDYGLAESIFN